MPAGKKAPNRPQNGDTVSMVMGSAPTTKESNQVQFTAPGPIKPHAIQNAGKHKFVAPDTKTR